MQQRVLEFDAAMEAVQLREAVMISHYELLSDLNWYRRRGGCNKATGMQFLTAWAPLLFPATPHFAEDWWSRIGGAGILADLQVDPCLALSAAESQLLAEQEFLVSFLESARSLKQLAERHMESTATCLTIQTAELWKGELCRIGLQLQTEGYNMRQALKVIMTREFAQDSVLRKAIPPVWKKVLKHLFKWSDEEKELLQSSLDEANIITSNSEFICAELGLEQLQAYLAGAGEDVGGKARVAFPLQPGMVFE
jgi:leucyl-tRNA synthetase